VQETTSALLRHYESFGHQVKNGRRISHGMAKMPVFGLSKLSGDPLHIKSPAPEKTQGFVSLLRYCHSLIQTRSSRGRNSFSPGPATGTPKGIWAIRLHSAGMSHFFLTSSSTTGA